MLKIQLIENASNARSNEKASLWKMAQIHHYSVIICREARST